VSCIVHGLDCLFIVWEAELPLVIMEMLISEGPCLEDVLPNSLDEDGCKLLA